ncbi:hypothetical protein AB0H03_06510 [Streptomyces sparsogenes]|uniref:hypothetical protein n=1 Tax=Streptomyces sparsogenes TaxID=67365 RepID=UPI0033C58CDB
MSAAERVAHAAATIRARWELGVSTDPQTEAAQALEDCCQLLDPEVAAELARLRARVAELEAAAEPEPSGPVPVPPPGLATAEAVEQLRDALAEDGALLQVVPVVDDVPVPAVLTDRAEAELLPAVVTTSARASAARLRRLLHPLDGGVSQ